MIVALVRRSTAHARRVLVFAVLFGLFAAAIGSTLLSHMTSQSDAPSAQSVRAANRLTSAAGMSADLDVLALVSGYNSATGTARVNSVASQLRAIAGVARVSDPVTSKDPAASKNLISHDGRSALVTAQFAAGVDRDAVARTVITRIGHEPGVTLGGVSITSVEIVNRVSDDLSRAELLALPVLFLLALWIFRSVVAAAVTIGVGVLTIVTTLLVLRVVDTQVQLSSFVLNLVTGLGLGLAIDYCLFIISRYREEVVRYGYTRQAVRAAGVAAGRTVACSALTVAASMSALTLFPQTFLYSMGIAGTTVTLCAALVSIVVLPAALMVLGPRIDSLALPGAARARARDTGDVRKIVWYRLAQWVMRHAAPVLLASVVLVIVIASPVRHTRFSNIDVSSLPRSSQSRQVSEQVAAQFPNSGGTTFNLAIEAGPAAGTSVTTYATRLRDIPNVQVASAPVYLGHQTWQLNLVAAGGPFQSRATNALAAVRARTAPFPVLVGGETAAFIDNEKLMVSHLPLALLVVAIAVLAVIFLLTGSLVLPVKTLLVNFLNVSMTVGVLVWVFQEGHLESLLGYSSTGAIDLSQPILVMVIGFALSTDYAVFLLARIKETWDVGRDNVEAVATGVGRSGRIISSAALLLCVAVGAFSTSSVLFIKQLGLGAAVSVILDATVIRAFLVPSAMRLMSGANWWAPGWMHRWFDRFGISEGGEPQSRVPALRAPKVIRRIPVPAAGYATAGYATPRFALQDGAVDLASAHTVVLEPVSMSVEVQQERAFEPGTFQPVAVFGSADAFEISDSPRLVLVPPVVEEPPVALRLVHSAGRDGEDIPADGETTTVIERVLAHSLEPLADEAVLPAALPDPTGPYALADRRVLRRSPRSQENRVVDRYRSRHSR